MNLGDIHRWLSSRLAEVLIRTFGRRIIYYPRTDNTNFEDYSSGYSPTFGDLVEFRAEYTIPSSLFVSKFGIDSPDEMIVTLGYLNTIRKLGNMPRPGDHLVDDTWGKWQIMSRHYENDGKLKLVVSRYAESKTISKSIKLPA